MIAMPRMFRVLKPLALLAFCCASVSAAPRAPVSPDEVFDPFRAHTIHIKLSGEGWDLLAASFSSEGMLNSTLCICETVVTFEWPNCRPLQIHDLLWKIEGDQVSRQK